MAAKRQCAGVVGGAKNPNRGKPCRNWAISGSDYCGIHGGSVKIATATAGDLQNRCVAHSTRTSERCKKAAIRGGTVCKTHGGAAKHVQKKARERFNDLIDPMINIAEKQVTAALAGQMSHSDEMALMKFIADRNGFTPGQHVEHEMKPWELIMTQVITDSTGMAISRALPPEMQAELDASPYAQPRIEDITDAEVIEDEHPRDSLPQIVPATRLGETATIRRVGSAEPPRRRR